MHYKTDLKPLTTITAAVTIPGLQALVSGFIFGVIAGALAEMWGADPWPWAGLVFGIVGLFAWLTGVSAWRAAVLKVQPPEPVKVYANESRLSLRVDWAEGREGLFADLNITDDQFITWACGVAAGRSLGENWWTGASNPFSKGSYHAMLARLEFHTVIRRAHKGRNSPYILTSKGQAIANGILDKYGPGLSSPTRFKYLPGGGYHV